MSEVGLLCCWFSQIRCPVGRRSTLLSFFISLLIDIDWVYRVLRNNRPWVSRSHILAASGQGGSSRNLGSILSQSSVVGAQGHDSAQVLVLVSGNLKVVKWVKKPAELLLILPNSVSCGRTEHSSLFLSFSPDRYRLTVYRVTQNSRP